LSQRINLFKNPLLQSSERFNVLAFEQFFDVLLDALDGVKFRAMGRLNNGNDILGLFQGSSHMGSSLVEVK
jgi:hypothetical protein